MKIEAGRTEPGYTDWKPYGEDNGCIQVDVDTSAYNFKNTPVYTTSLGGKSDHWKTTGASSVYNATKDGFTIYIRRIDCRDNCVPITPDYANDPKRIWHINWIGVEEVEEIAIAKEPEPVGPLGADRE